VSDRLEQLAEILQAGRSATRTSADPAAEDLGASEGIGLEFDDGAHVSLYSFDSWDDAGEAAVQLDDLADELDDGIHRTTATNGPILFVGSIPMEDEGDARPRFALAALVSSFAGQERG